MSTQAPTTPRRTDRRARVSPYLLWFGVLGGTIAWVVYLGIAWSTTEITCLAPTGASVDQRGGSLGTAGTAVVWATAIGCWVVAWLAFAALMLVRRRRRRLAAAGTLDVLAEERISLLTVLGVFLDLMGVAIITGGAIALLVLEPCG